MSKKMIQRFTCNFKQQICILQRDSVKTSSWKENGVSCHPSIWSSDFTSHIDDLRPWQKKVQKVEPILAVPTTRPRKKVVNLVSKYVPETQMEDER